jgi:phosphatidyl-myo-inositol alpha-mannosyltransferase
LGSRARGEDEAVKIGLVSPYDWSYPGGVQDHIRHLAAELRARNHTVRILTPATGLRGRQVEYGTYKLAWAAPLRVNGSVARISLAPDVRGHLRTVLQLEQFDVLHLHEPLASALPISVLRAAGKSGAVHVGTFHAWARHGLTSPPEWAYTSAKPFLQRYFRRLHGRIAVSSAAAEFISRFFPSEYRIIPNGVDVRRFGSGAIPLPQFRDGKLNVLFFGRIEHRKGLKFLLRAVPRIREQFADTRFIIGGDGPLRADFERWVERKGWPDVVFLGRVPEEDKPSLFASAHVYCSPSIGGESLGIVLLEAMASGRAVVASDIPGYRSVVTSGTNGLLVRPGDSEQLAWAICRLLGDDEGRARLGHAGRLRAEDFSWAQVGREVEDYYLELLAERAALTARRRALLGPGYGDERGSGSGSVTAAP